MSRLSAQFRWLQSFNLATFLLVFGAIAAEAQPLKVLPQPLVQQLEVSEISSEAELVGIIDSASLDSSAIGILSTPIFKQFPGVIKPKQGLDQTTVQVSDSSFSFASPDVEQTEVAVEMVDSHSAADLGGVLEADPVALMHALPPAETLVAADAPATPPLAPPCPPSLAPNLPVLRHVKKPRGNRLLQTEVNPNLGIRCKDLSESFWTRDFLTGNWGGLRDRLFNQGYEFTLVNFNDFYGNVDGGRRRGFAYNGVTVFGIDIYTSKTGWWPNGQIHVTGVSVNRSAKLRDTYVGTFNSLYAIEPLVDGFKLTENWYGHKFNNGRLELRIGQIFPFIRIAQMMSSAIFTNPSFQYPAFLGSTPDRGLATSFAAPPFGVQGFYNITPAITLSGHLFDGFNAPGGGRDNIPNTSIILTPEEGMEGVLELSYKLNQQPGTTRLPGNYKLGGQFHTGRFLNNNVNVDGRSLGLFEGIRETASGNYALYAKAEQMLFSESREFPGITQGLTAFAQGQVAPLQDRNTISYNVAAGLNYEGLFRGRDRDVLGLGVSYTRFSEGIREFDRDRRRLNPTHVVRDGEMVIELIYLAEIAPWWVVTTSVQHVIHPNGSSQIPNTTVLGISTRFAL